MQYAFFDTTESSTYDVALLVPTLNKADISKYYLSKHIIPYTAIAIQLAYEAGKKKSSAAFMKAWIEEELVPTLADIKVKNIIVADAEYFKALTKQPKADSNIGYALPSPYGPWMVFYVPSTRQVFFDPEKVTQKIEQSLSAYHQYICGTYQAPGQSLLSFEEYPRTTPEIIAWLQKLIEMDKPLAIDIEAFSLKHVT